MVSVMPPFGGHLGTGSTVFGGGPADTRVELTGLNTRYHFAVEANTASSLASSAVAYEGRPGPPSGPDGEVRQQGKILNIIISHSIYYPFTILYSMIWLRALL